MTKPILLLTRPKESSFCFFDSLGPEIAAKARLIVSPLLEIAGTGVQPDLSGVRGVIFTSANAVGFAPLGQGRAAFCVGERTQAAAEKRGWKVKKVSATAGDLLADLDMALIEGPVMHLAGRHLRMDIVSALRSRGVMATCATVYDQKLLPLSDEAQSAMAGTAPVIAPLFSPRSASHFVEQAGDLARVHAVVISPAVAAVLPEGACASIQVAQQPTGLEMRRSVEKLLADCRLA